jgi:hypothetical protein
MKGWYNGIYKALIIAGVIAFIIGFFTNGNASLGSYIAGYSVLVLGIMLILLILFNGIMQTKQDQSTFNILFSIIMTTGPFLLMLGVIAFILYLMIKYKNNIISGHVSPNYNSFSNITIILLLIQLYIVYTNISTEKFEATGKISKLTSSTLYLLGVLEGISAVILYTILNYFTTDGFSTIRI